jgi:branched-chain amino acid transport system permease protein
VNRSWTFYGGCLLAVALSYALTLVIQNEYPFFAGYVVIQFVLLATAWNIAGGYAGYVNFGTAGFFGAGSYAAVAAALAFGAPLALQILIAALAGAAISLAVAYLSAQLRGVYYSIATIAVAVILEAIALNWSFVGGARGISYPRPPTPPGFSNYTAFLFVVMVVLAVAGVVIARFIEHSKLGRGLAAVRDNEMAAEACGVPTLTLKIVAITISGALMAVAGAPYALYASYIDPTAAFSMNYSLAALTMSLVGGTSTWVGPVIGAVLLAVIQQLLTVFASSQVNQFILGLILVFSVILLPGGAFALVRQQRRKPA